MCPPDSKGELYTALLEKVTGYVVNRGNLELTLGRDGEVGTMYFVPAASLNQPPPDSLDETKAEPEPESRKPKDIRIYSLPAGVDSTVWHLVSIDEPGSSLGVDRPEKYTLRFLKGGQLEVRADCNQGRGEYLPQDDGRVNFGVMAMTLAMCGPNSLDRKFLRLITKKNAGLSIDNGRLHVRFDRFGPTITLVFRPSP